MNIVTKKHDRPVKYLLVLNLAVCYASLIGIIVWLLPFDNKSWGMASAGLMSSLTAMIVSIKMIKDNMTRYRH